jgi:hypothetical protein
MSTNPHARAVKAYLEELCTILDNEKRLVRPRRRWWKSPVVLPAAAVGLAAGLVGCSGTVESSNGLSENEICNDNLDNDGDGKIDCADTDCDCTSPAYSAPQPDAGKDATPHADAGQDTTPVKETLCSDNIDNDGDGLVDCADSDCASMCSAPAYMAPPVEICSDGLDNDYDGKIDCADTDCYSDPYCGADYAAPVETICNDGKDNDYDGKIDCKDSDCYSDPNCMQAAYAAPAE